MLGFIKNRKLRKAIDKALADHVITDAEIEAINRLQVELGLADDKAQREYEKKVRGLVEKLTGKVVARVQASRRFSPEDEQELMDICRQLKVKPELDLDSFRVYRKLWEVEETGRLEPEPIEADIRLARGESCYHRCPASWLQLRTVREHHGYVGGSIGIRVAKGVTLRFGRAVPITTTREQLTPLASGGLYVTNKKIAFVGSPRSTNVTYGRLARWELWQDAIEVIKNSGKPDVFRIAPVDIEYIDALLQTV